MCAAVTVAVDAMKSALDCDGDGGRGGGGSSGGGDAGGDDDNGLTGPKDEERCVICNSGEESCEENLPWGLKFCWGCV